MEEDISPGLAAVEEGHSDIAVDVPSIHPLDFPSFSDLGAHHMVGSGECSAKARRTEEVIDVLAAYPTFPPIEILWLYPNLVSQDGSVGGCWAFDSGRVPLREERQQVEVEGISL